MKTQFIIHQLESHIPVFESLLTPVEDKMVKWRPSAEKWCLLEIICHLVDEEKEDFRKRVRLALFPKDFDFEPIDPVGWVDSRNYLDQNYQTKIKEWVKEREISIQWLKYLDSVNWAGTFSHLHLGELSAKQMLANWLAHDYIHIRQITQLKRAYLNEFSGENLEYAGRW